MRQKATIWRQLTYDGKMLFSGTGDNKISVWDVQASTSRSTADVGHELLDAVFSPNGERFITECGKVNNPQLWRVSEAKPFADLVHANPVVFEKFDDSGVRIVTREWAAGRPFHLWDAKTGLESCDPIESDFDAEADVAQTAAFDASGKRLVIARKAGFATVDTATGKIISAGHTDGDLETDSVRFSADGSTVAVLTRSALTHERGSVQIFESATGKRIRSIAPGTGLYEIGPDGKQLFCGDLASDSTDLWDLSTGAKLQIFDGLIGAMALSPDGRTIAFNKEKQTSVWRLREK
jgi:WD40 repeat protein